MSIPVGFSCLGNIFGCERLRGGAFVDWIFFRVRSRWPRVVAIDFGRYLFAVSGVIPGNVTKLLLRMAFSHVCLTGLKHAACMNSTRSRLEDGILILFMVCGWVAWDGSLVLSSGNGGSGRYHSWVSSSQCPVRIHWCLYHTRQ